MNVKERRDRAIHAAQSIARDYGLPDGVPRILKDTNHTIVHLWPSQIVAKVSTQKIFRSSSSSLEKEVCVAGLLASLGAPVVQPATTLPCGPHRLPGVELTFWNYYQPDETRTIPHRKVGETLRAVHDTLDRLADRLPTLPSFALQLEEADELLRDPAAVPQLPKDDRVFLRDLYRRVVDALGTESREDRALHGECHSQQTIATSGGLLWLDFEAACRGPREWDLAGIDRRAVKAYGPVDTALLSLVKTARLLCITTWCWTQPDRHPEVREAAEYHLKNLKRTARIGPFESHASM